MRLTCGGIERGQQNAELCRMLGVDTARIAAFVKPLQTFMANARRRSRLFLDGQLSKVF
jgi:hypothetical protein